jgi:hypothetical protein
MLRARLTDLFIMAKEKGYIKGNQIKKKTELFFVILEGAYYYTSLIKNKQDYDEKMNEFRNHALSIFHL